MIMVKAIPIATLAERSFVVCLALLGYTWFCMPSSTLQHQTQFPLMSRSSISAEQLDWRR
jgi:hypothetical protein